MVRRTKFVWYLFTVTPIVLLILGYFYPPTFFSEQEKLRVFINSFGILAPLVFILINILQVVLTPISHYAIGLLGGFMFGTWSGFLYNWVGRVIGSYIAFNLGRRFGRQVLKHVVKEDTMKKYDTVFDKGKLVLFLMYFLPLFPDDELSYLTGFSSMNIKVYVPLMMLGHIGGSLGLAFLGSGLSYNHPVFIALSLISIAAAIIFVMRYKNLQKG